MVIMSLFVCPCCRGGLAKTKNGLVCAAGHNYDLASEGYVNLLPANRKNTKAPGDNSAMVEARRAFLNRGHYGILKNTLARMVLEKTAGLCHVPVVADAGCGEGYYTLGVEEAFDACGRPVSTAGFDISKPAVRQAAKLASKEGRKTEFAVAGVYDVPLEDECCDVVTNIFAPLCDSEFYRILRSGGWLILIQPGRNHLMGLKEVLYERPYPNKTKAYSLERFENRGIDVIHDFITVEGKEEIKNLFHMTPYYWRTPPEASKKLDALEKLITEIEFEIHLFCKK